MLQAVLVAPRVIRILLPVQTVSVTLTYPLFSFGADTYIHVAYLACMFWYSLKSITFKMEPSLQSKGNK